jgi:prepilin-type N-terminal cleavage/methylation domain-containing protein
VDRESEDELKMGRRIDGHTPEAGFSLIEVLMALTILAIGLLGLALLQTTAIKGNAIASKSSIATQIAQDKLEWFRNQAWTHPRTAGRSQTTLRPQRSMPPCPAIRVGTLSSSAEQIFTGFGR